MLSGKSDVYVRIIGYKGSLSYCSQASPSLKPPFAVMLLQDADGQAEVLVI